MQFAKTDNEWKSALDLNELNILLTSAQEMFVRCVVVIRGVKVVFGI